MRSKIEKLPKGLLPIGIAMVTLILLAQVLMGSAKADGRDYVVTASNGVITHTLEHQDSLQLEPYEEGEFLKYDIRISSPVTVTGFVLRIQKEPWMNLLYGGSLTCQTLSDSWRCTGDLFPEQVQQATLQYRPSQATTYCAEWSIQTAPTSSGNNAAYDLAKVFRSGMCTSYLPFTAK